MASEVRPPVTEVVISVAFDPQSCLAGPQLFMTLRELISRFSKIEEQPPYEMPVELPPELQFSRPPQPPFRIVGGAGALEHRYWLFDPIDDSLLVQVQSNYFAVNWRKTKTSDSYIGFENLMEKFEEILGQVQAAVTANGGVELALRQAELSYINVIRPDSLWSDHHEISKIISLRTPSIDELEQLAVAYSRSILDGAGEFRGRIQSVVQTAFEARVDDMSISEAVHSGLVPVINISNFVRSSRLNRPSTTSILKFLRDAHVETGASFVATTTENARKHWGI